jgi:hypothetical protein
MTKRKKKRKNNGRIRKGRKVVMLEQEIGTVLRIDYINNRKEPYLVRGDGGSPKKGAFWYSSGDLILLPKTVSKNQLKALSILLR